MCGWPLSRSSRVWARRDLPMPGSPIRSATRPSPALACCQRRCNSASSSSRPTSGVRSGPCRASKRLSAPLSRSTRVTMTGMAKPLISTAPRSSYSNNPPVSRRVLGAITTVPGSANACSRAARFGVSPTTACSCEAPWPIRSPTTTSPVAMPTRTCNGAAATVSSPATFSTSFSPARTARSASCSPARG